MHVALCNILAQQLLWLGLIPHACWNPTQVSSPVDVPGGSAELQRLATMCGLVKSMVPTLLPFFFKQVLCATRTRREWRTCSVQVARS